MAHANDTGGFSGDGVLALDPESLSIAGFRHLLNEPDGAPGISFNTDIENSGRMAFVGSDYYTSGRIASGLANLIAGGQASIGIVNGSDSVRCHSQRVSGFIDNCRERYPNMKVIAKCENLDDDLISYEQTRKMLRLAVRCTRNRSSQMYFRLTICQRRWSGRFWKSSILSRQQSVLKMLRAQQRSKSGNGIAEFALCLGRQCGAC